MKALPSFILELSSQRTLSSLVRNDARAFQQDYTKSALGGPRNRSIVFKFDKIVATFGASIFLRLLECNATSWCHPVVIELICWDRQLVLGQSEIFQGRSPLFRASFGEKFLSTDPERKS